MNFGSLYPSMGRASGQETVNAPDAVNTRARTGGGIGDIPFVGPSANGLAGYFGVSLPVLIALGVMTWFLFRYAD